MRVFVCCAEFGQANDGVLVMLGFLGGSKTMSETELSHILRKRITIKVTATSLSLFLG